SWSTGIFIASTKSWTARSPTRSRRSPLLNRSSGILFSKSVLHDRELAFDLDSVRFFPRRQFQIAAKRRGRFVDRESRLHRRHFEDHPAGLTEVDRLEVAAIADLGDLAAVSEQLRPEAELFSSAADRHRDMMDGAEAVDRRLRVRMVSDVDDLAGTAAM